MKHLKHLTATGLLFLFTAPLSLFADNFTFELGGHYVTKGKSDIKDARKQDFNVWESGTSFGADQVLTGNEDKDKFKTTPWANLSYRKDFRNFGLQFGAAYETFSGTYNYSNISVPTVNSSTIAYTGTNGTATEKETNKDLEVGLRLPVIQKSLYLTPRIGRRYSTLDISGSETGVAYSSTVAGSTRTNLMLISDATLAGKGDASGNYLGINLEWNLTKFLDLYAGYTAYPGLNGNLDLNSNQEAIQFSLLTMTLTPGGSSSITGLTLPFYWKSAYKLNTNRWDLGFRWKIGSIFFIKTGFQRETSIASFPGYAEYATSVAMVGGSSTSGSSFVEPISNALLYGKNHVRQWESVNVSVGANVDFGNMR